MSSVSEGPFVLENSADAAVELQAGVLASFVHRKGQVVWERLLENRVGRPSDLLGEERWLQEKIWAEMLLQEF